MSYKSTRYYTNLLLEYIDDGILDPKHIVDCFTSYCSEDEVKDMMQSNDLLLEDEYTEEEE